MRVECGPFTCVPQSLLCATTVRRALIREYRWESHAAPGEPFYILKKQIFLLPLCRQERLVSFICKQIWNIFLYFFECFFILLLSFMRPVSLVFSFIVFPIINNSWYPHFYLKLQFNTPQLWPIAKIFQKWKKKIKPTVELQCILYSVTCYSAVIAHLYYGTIWSLLRFGCFFADVCSYR